MFFAAILLGLSLVFTQESFFEVSSLIVVANFPVMIIEGLITAFCIGFLKKVHPTMLPGASKNGWD